MFVEFVVTDLILDVKENNEAARDPDCKTGYVDQ
jgi:hypothetical protein